jgi:hypothetical protein
VSRRFPNDDFDEADSIEWPGFGRWYLIALGVALVLGLVSGVGWIAWNLIKLHLLS